MYPFPGEEWFHKYLSPSHILSPTEHPPHFHINSQGESNFGETKPSVTVFNFYRDSHIRAPVPREEWFRRHPPSSRTTVFYSPSLGENYFRDTKFPSYPSPVSGVPPFYNPSLEEYDFGYKHHPLAAPFLLSRGLPVFYIPSLGDSDFSEN